jgi:hypothetical protein
LAEKSNIQVLICCQMVRNLCLSRARQLNSRPELLTILQIAETIPLPSTYVILLYLLLSCRWIQLMSSVMSIRRIS